jgi:hypothetical protein
MVLDPRRPKMRPGEAQWVPIDRFTHTRARHGARMARARATWAPGRFGPGLDWSGVRQVSAIYPSIHPIHPSNPAHTPIHEPSIRTHPCAVHSHVHVHGGARAWAGGIHGKFFLPTEGVEA